MQTTFIGYGIVALSISLAAHGQNFVLISDFNAQNPLQAYDDWAGHLQPFTDGSITGQEVNFSGIGGPSSHGGGALEPLLTGPLDLGGTSMLAFTARLLPGMKAGLVQISIFTDPGQNNHFSTWRIDASKFNYTTFTTIDLPLNSPDGISSGGFPATLSSIDGFSVGGDGVLGNGDFRMQFADLRAVASVPEPSSAALAAFGFVVFCGWRTALGKRS